MADQEKTTGTSIGVESEDTRTDRKLKAKIEEALRVGRYLVTVSLWEDGEIRHQAILKSFPKRDVIPTLEHIVDRARREQLW
ncbi:unnamed protein product [marine sediment metagenome]|uniref:Uncharacterized protein n=1 Tax=marine sediment metagenome TaxID=412755 RepID=X1C9E4_9ZZZZ